MTASRSISASTRAICSTSPRRSKASRRCCARRSRLTDADPGKGRKQRALCPYADAGVGSADLACVAMRRSDVSAGMLPIRCHAPRSGQRERSLARCAAWRPGLVLRATILRRHEHRPHHAPEADEFPQLSRRETRRSAQRRGAGRAERRRQDQRARGHLAARRPGAACAAPRSTRSRSAKAMARWAVSAEIEGALGLATLGTGIEPPAAGDASAHAALPDRSRACGLGRSLRRSFARALAGAGHGRACSPVRPRSAAASSTASCSRWIPAIAPASPRSSAALRSRNRLLEDPRRRQPLARRGRARDRRARGRRRARRARETVERLHRRDRRARDGRCLSVRRRSALTADGASCCPTEPAVEVEDRYRAVCATSRARDAAAGRTLDGPQLTDLAVRLRAKEHPAADASTGEQKALLIGLVLAHAGLVTRR